ncbi:putative ABC transporter [Weissella oryzae SG25]|uniref:Putative ABC transporter n=1 Tax=Weissella oryzae (strain DSM 25784 / JCM 18191 / LMG 30913 / SG25) TaxID=1329250 RepID=A0A069D375_WEIOS|nr:hypothetical protein [Weissella oryzae]GAK31826.1 putative ABC transporter [Weissella oryzae SG25]
MNMLDGQLDPIEPKIFGEDWKGQAIYESDSHVYKDPFNGHYLNLSDLIDSNNLIEARSYVSTYFMFVGDTWDGDVPVYKDEDNHVFSTDEVIEYIKENFERVYTNGGNS